MVILNDKDVQNKSNSYMKVCLLTVYLYVPSKGCAVRLIESGIS